MTASNASLVLKALEKGPGKVSALATRVPLTTAQIGRVLSHLYTQGLVTYTGTTNNYVYELTEPPEPPPRERPASSIWDYAQRGVL